MAEEQLTADCVAAMAELAGAPIPESRLETVAGTLAAFGPLLSVIREVDVTQRPAARFTVEPWGQES